LSRFPVLSSKLKMASSRFRPGRLHETVGGQPIIAPAWKAHANAAIRGIPYRKSEEFI
jgi:hypothetical protein